LAHSAPWPDHHSSTERGKIASLECRIDFLKLLMLGTHRESL
jgi:hypothetical protein